MQHEHGGEQERDPPAPRLEGGVALEGGEDEQHAGREQVAERHTGLRPRGPEAAAARRRRARRPSAPRRPTRRRRRSPAPAGRPAAGSAPATPMLAYVGSRPIAKVAIPIIISDDDEHLLAADPVTEVTEDHAAERPGDEPDGVGAERQQRRVDRVGVREEQRAEDQRRGRAVEEEVVPLDGGADQAGEDDLDDVGAARCRGRSPEVTGSWCVDMCCLPFVLVWGGQRRSRRRRSSRRPSGMSCR